ncbi:M12 family metallopeptidase [Pseudomonas sp.]|uniref:M12 family metallopeptidase n=1 Tax=Pseudomonas sp. TaxID=306 RepID=UPI003BB797E1
MNSSKICKTIHPADPLLAYQTAVTESQRNALNGGKAARSVSAHSKLWSNFRTLSVCFLDELSAADAKAFKSTIWKWAKLANLNIVFTSRTNATIRIKTNTDLNISRIGTDCLLAEPGEPTTYIAEKPGSEFFEATVLHEFGHVLGLHHEHLHPDANIPWNKQKVRELYARHGWSPEEIEKNFFDPIDTLRLVLTAYDKNSIMHYRVDKELTDGVYELAPNKILSEDDMRMILSIYPETPSESPDDPSHRP